jgi:hypothetical protein
MIVSEGHAAVAWDGLAAVVEVTDGEIARVSLYGRDAATVPGNAPTRGNSAGTPHP